MRITDSRKHLSRRTTQSTAFVLLLLIAHAFVVSATHNHRIRLGEDASPSVRLNASRTDESTRLETNNHTQCLLCRLQRSLIADLYSPASVSAPSLANFARGEASNAPVHANEPFRLPAGRAPPSPALT